LLPSNRRAAMGGIEQAPPPRHGTLDPLPPTAKNTPASEAPRLGEIIS
jgi:hypothetical protein